MNYGHIERVHVRGHFTKASHTTHADFTYKHIHHEALAKIEVIEMLSKKLSKFGMMNRQRTNENELSDEIKRTEQSMINQLCSSK